MIKNNVQPIADLIKKDMINVEMPKHDSSVKPQNSKEIEHLKTIGLVNVCRKRPSLPTLTKTSPISNTESVDIMSPAPKITSCDVIFEYFL